MLCRSRSVPREVGLNCSFRPAEQTESRQLYLGNNAALLGQRREGDRYSVPLSLLTLSVYSSRWLNWLRRMLHYEEPSGEFQVTSSTYMWSNPRHRSQFQSNGPVEDMM